MVRTKGKVYITILLLALGLLLVGCSGKDQLSVKADRAEPEKKINSKNADNWAFVGDGEETYYMCTFVQGASYWKGVFKGFKSAGDQLGVRTVYEGCDDYSAYAQLKVFERIVAKKPKGIALAPINAEAFKEPIDEAMESGVKVMCFSSDSSHSKRLTLVTSDNVREAEYAADFIAQKLGGVGKVGIIERPNQSNHAIRVKKFIEMCEKVYTGVKVVARVNAEGDEARAARLTTQMISEHPDLDFIYCVAGIEGMGAGAAVKESGKDIKVFCYDADPPVIDMVKEGIIYAVIHPNTVNQGYWSLMTLYVAANDLINPISDWKQAKNSPLPAVIDNGFDVVVKENADYFYVD